MSIRSDYEKYLAAREDLEKDPHGKNIWMDQLSRYVHPFRLCGNIWYVGDSWVCVHLIDTGNGLLLIDAGNFGATHMLVQAIWEAGFNPADVKWIILSHGHLDHIGGVEFFQKMFGTKIYLGAPDAKMFRERPQLSFVQDTHNICDHLFTPDVEIQDDQILEFGGLPIHFYLTPGHTEGVISCFFETEEKGQKLKVGYFGGFGFNTMNKEQLTEMGDPQYRTREIFLESLAKVRNQPVDVFLGNHCINNDTIGRRKIQQEHPEGPNPFIDSTLWGSYLDAKRDQMLAFMADPANC